MEPRLALYVLGVLMIVAGSVTALADQSDKLVGVYEVPPFVSERVEVLYAPAAVRPATGNVAKPESSTHAG